MCIKEHRVSEKCSWRGVRRQNVVASQRWEANVVIGNYNGTGCMGYGS